MDLTIFWQQLFSPLNNGVSIFFVVLITVLSERLVKEMEKANRFEICPNPNNLLKNVVNFIWRFILSFLFVFFIVYIIIVIISLILAALGISINYFYK